METDSDLYILRVEDRRAAGLVPFDSVREGIEKELKQAQAKQLREAWIDRLMRKYYVQTF